jgi:hypothetical protein
VGTGSRGKAGVSRVERGMELDLREGVILICRYGGEEWKLELPTVQREQGGDVKGVHTSIISNLRMTEG